MDFDSLPQDEKIVCLCSIFPEMDPVILNDLLEMYKTAESLFPIILQMTDEDYRPNDVPPRYNPKPPLSLIYPHLQASAPPIDDYESTMRENSNTIAELELDLESWKPMEQKCLPKKTGENKLSDKISEVTSKVKKYVSEKMSGNSKGNYSQLRTQEWVDWDEELDDPENETIVYDSRRDNNNNLRKRN
jgi:hypothetical protein